MLLFHRGAEDLDLAAARRHGIAAPGGAALRLFPTLAGAAAGGGEGPLLVVDGTSLGWPVEAGTEVRLPQVPAAAIQNLGPYRPPAAVVAGGGYVACALSEGRSSLDSQSLSGGRSPSGNRSLPGNRSASGDMALLLIYRRGQWELPKGKKDPGEPIEACAAREVREEVGIEQLEVVRPLGATQHGYPDGDTYAVKTTYWYLMRTPERSFAPERQEGIRRVAPARWAVARAHVAHGTTRRHMGRIEAVVRDALK